MFAGCGWEDDLAVGPVRDEDRLGHALVERGDEVEARRAVGLKAAGLAADWFGVVKDAYDGWIAAGQDACYPAGASSITSGRSFVDQHFVALHGSIQLVGRDEEIVFARSRAVGPDEAEAIAMQVEFAGDQLVAGDPLRGFQR